MDQQTDLVVDLIVQTNQEMPQGPETDIPETPPLLPNHRQKPPEPVDESKQGETLGRYLGKVMGQEGQSAITVFRDFLTVTESTLIQLPTHMNSLLHEKKLATDPPDLQRQWKEIAGRYRKPEEVFRQFAEAYAFLLDTTLDSEGNPTYADALGYAYMQQVSMRDQRYKGQYFTPSNIAYAMADMTMGDIGGEIQKRLREAFEKACVESPMAYALALTSLAFADDEKGRPWFLRRMLKQMAPYYNPVTVLDPCVGSGVMLLAAAAVAPRWATDLNLIQYYGVDIDASCAQMARINCMLYGMNGHAMTFMPCEEFEQLERMEALPAAGGIWDAEAIPEPVLENLPEPVCSIYREVRAEKDEGKKLQARNKLAQQMSLFPMADFPADPEARPRKSKAVTEITEEGGEAKPLTLFDN